MGFEQNILGQCLLFSNENQKECANLLNYEGKKVLTVASSGDQYLSCVYHGARVIDIFDIDERAMHLTYLKIAAIKRLSYSSFFNFFVPSSSNDFFMNLDTFIEISCALPPESLSFWKKMFRKATFFEGFWNSLYDLEKKCNSEEFFDKGRPYYASRREYDRLQALLEVRNYPDFYLASFDNLFPVLTKCYDILYLSNIMSVRWVRENLSFYEQLTQLMPLLSQISPGGIALVNYFQNLGVPFASAWKEEIKKFPCSCEEGIFCFKQIDGVTTSDDQVLLFKKN